MDSVRDDETTPERAALVWTHEVPIAARMSKNIYVRKTSPFIFVPLSGKSESPSVVKNLPKVSSFHRGKERGRYYDFTSRSFGARNKPRKASKNVLPGWLLRGESCHGSCPRNLPKSSSGLLFHPKREQDIRLETRRFTQPRRTCSVTVCLEKLASSSELLEAEFGPESSKF
jgi:hypothetical protein